MKHEINGGVRDRGKLKLGTCDWILSSSLFLRSVALPPLSSAFAECCYILELALTPQIKKVLTKCLNGITNFNLFIIVLKGNSVFKPTKFDAPNFLLIVVRTKVWPHVLTIWYSALVTVNQKNKGRRQNKIIQCRLVYLVFTRFPPQLLIRCPKYI